MGQSRVSQSKFLSLVLRHQPELIGLVLDGEGWADLEQLLSAANAHGNALTDEDVRAIVAGSDKQRFALSADGRRIRAHQGHSVAVDLNLARAVPPDVLFHGTASRFIASIRAQGLVRGSRHHVHLSANEATARTVGARHGTPVVLRVDAGRMHAEGFVFFQSENGVWLVDEVPVTYLEFL